jgi:hypothetical protein
MKKIIKNVLFKLGYRISKVSNATPDSQNYFWHYYSSFNPIDLVNKFKKDNIAPSSKHLTNFLGVKIRPYFFPTLSLKANSIDPPPMPNNFHADLAEWGSCLRSVDLAGKQFSMLELGCGWGCWMNNLGVAAKSEGKEIKLYGIEGDEGHVSFATEALADNCILPSEFELFHGVAGKKSSITLFIMTWFLH